jgi:hypothetical protein
MTTITAADIRPGDVLVNNAGEPVWLITEAPTNWSGTPDVNLRAVTGDGDEFTTSLPEDTTLTAADGVAWDNLRLWDGSPGRTLRLN